MDDMTKGLLLFAALFLISLFVGFSTGELTLP